jgi:hypothetical protein
MNGLHGSDVSAEARRAIASAEARVADRDGFRETLGPCCVRLREGLFDDPTGKSLRPSLAIKLWHVQPLSQKYFCFSEIKIRLYDSPSRPTQRGVSRSSRT